jgi:IS5 family transposase
VPTVFTKNRDRLLAGDIAQAFFQRVLDRAKRHHLLSDEHFTVDGTLIEAWASQKSFKPKEPPPDVSPPDDPGNPTVDFHGEKRSNATHESQTDPQARLYRKGPGHEAKLAYLAHALMENRNGLVVNTRVTAASGRAERDAAVAMIEELPGSGRVTLAADKGYDTREFVATLRGFAVTPHVAQNQSGRASAIDRRTTRHPGYAVSQRARKRVEEIFGWMKTVGLMRKTRHKGLSRVGWTFTLTAAAYNLVRIRNLLEAT